MARRPVSVPTALMVALDADLAAGIRLVEYRRMRAMVEALKDKMDTLWFAMSDEERRSLDHES